MPGDENRKAGRPRGSRGRRGQREGVYVLLPPEHKARIQVQAERDGRSDSATVAELVGAWVEGRAPAFAPLLKEENS